MDRGASGQVEIFLKIFFSGDGKIQSEMEVARPHKTLETLKRVSTSVIFLCSLDVEI